MPWYPLGTRTSATIILTNAIQDYINLHLHCNVAFVFLQFYTNKTRFNLSAWLLAPGYLQPSRWSGPLSFSIHTLTARFMGPAWGPSGADRTQVGPMLAPWTLLSGYHSTSSAFQCSICVQTILHWSNKYIQLISMIVADDLLSVLAPGHLQPSYWPVPFSIHINQHHQCSNVTFMFILFYSDETSEFD